MLGPLKNRDILTKKDWDIPTKLIKDNLRLFTDFTFTMEVVKKRRNNSEKQPCL